MTFLWITAKHGKVWDIVKNHLNTIHICIICDFCDKIKSVVAGVRVNTTAKTQEETIETTTLSLKLFDKTKTNEAILQPTRETRIFTTSKTTHRSRKRPGKC